ncbi:hypothetical protein KF840_18065 [bacterium]|nr:hypothetical protein [bacterium]
MSGRRRRRGGSLRALRPLGDVRVAGALLLLATLAAPRAPLVYHRHAGGEHAHVHADAGLRALFAAADRPAPARDGGRRPAYHQDRGSAAGHVHQQTRYHAAVAVAAPFLAVAAPLAPLLASVDRRPPTRLAAPATARGPPRVPVR